MYVLKVVAIYKKRGGYTTPFIIDQDSSLTEQYALDILPSHYFLDRRGIIKEVVRGDLSSDEMGEILLKIQ